ncbi:hypothetical protein Aglo02_03630 [Actinokineospora globicatena]|nr:hypothetical protein Aglo02_03630 [Actinokineospora globicatena]
MVDHDPTRTPTGMSGPRFFAANNPATAVAEKASHPIPYTVSVGTTTNRPALTALAAAPNPSTRCPRSPQSKTVTQRA